MFFIISLILLQFSFDFKQKICHPKSVEKKNLHVKAMTYLCFYFDRIEYYKREKWKQLDHWSLSITWKINKS